MGKNQKISFIVHKIDLLLLLTISGMIIANIKSNITSEVVLVIVAYIAECVK